jgi:hypothetical protein
MLLECLIQQVVQVVTRIGKLAGGFRKSIGGGTKNRTGRLSNG